MTRNVLACCLVFLGVMACAIGAYAVLMSLIASTGAAGDLSGLGVIFGLPLLLIGILLMIAGRQFLKV